MRILAIFWIMGCCGRTYAEPPRTVTAPEYAIKAVFLYNLIKYADWPPQSPQSDSGRPLVIAVIGEDPFGIALDEAVRDRTVRGRPVVILRTSDLKAIRAVHLAFVSASESGRAREIVGVLTALSVLTVGDSESTARAGAAVNLVMVQDKVRFDVNQSATRRCNVALSSQLLKLARHILEPGS
jgi:hypothetical protein